MAISFGCEQCGRLVRVKDSLAGRKIKCPHCGAVQRVASAETEAPRASTGVTQESGPLLDKFLGICMAASLVIGILGFIAGSTGVMALGGAAQFGFFLGIAVFAAVCTFAPKRVLTHPKIAATIGTKNPIVARIVCAIAALVLGGLSLAAFMAGKH